MNRIFTRNFFLFCCVLILCIGVLAYILVKGERDIKRTSDWVVHTNSTIIEASEFATFVEGMVATERGYLLSHNPEFLNRYEMRKTEAGKRINNLRVMIDDNRQQIDRLDKMQAALISLSERLDKSISEIDAPKSDSDLRDEILDISARKAYIFEINSAILQTEYLLLNKRAQAVESRREQYFITLFVGLIIGTALLLIFNVFLLRAQSRTVRAEEYLKENEERFALAIAGTNDGIFDWDLRTGTVFYSRQFFSMLGEQKDDFFGTINDFKSRIHPNDLEKTWQYIESYLKGELSEYARVFRMRHENGQWLWINSRAKAIFNHKNKAIRLVGANTDITYMKEYQERLKEEKNAAEKANMAKGEFLAHMSHEIRTPLTAISGIAEIFEKRQENLDDRQKQLVRTLSTSTSSLKDLISDILSFSKIESGELELDEKPFVLEDLFSEVISIMSVKAREKGIYFVFDYDQVKGKSFHGDSIRIRQILINLIGNALKFTDAGSVTVRAAEEGKGKKRKLRIDIIDTGIGISSQNFDLVFERFKQADSSVSRKHGGTGLGLPISRSLARLMGGDIQLESKLEQGSTFTLILPCHLSQEETCRKEDSTIPDRQLNNRLKAIIKEKTKILLVEDYEGNIVFLSYLLDDLGCGYDIAHTGVEALDLWKKNKYSLILMDIQMPEMDGFTATSHIRRMEAEADQGRTPIIGLTAHALMGDKDKCIEAGMDSYLPKPIVEVDLKEEILKYLKAA